MWGAIAGAALGALAGGQKDQASSTSSVNVAPESALEKQAGNMLSSNMTQLGNYVNAGPGMSEINASQASNNSFANMLKQYAAGGFLPSESDMSTANKFAQSAFNPQAVALQQQFGQQQQRAAQLASQLGRPVNDPIIQAKLSQEYMQGNERLQAAQGSYANQFALNLPQQRLGYTAQLANFQSSLASQAMANRQALLSIGSQVKSQEQAFRANTASRTTTQESGGGFKGMLTGAMGGASAFMGLSNAFAANNLMQAQTAAIGQQGASPMGQPNVGPQFSSPMGQPNVGPQMPLAAAPMQQSYNIPPALQPSSFTNSLQIPNPQFNIMGQMGGGAPPPMSFVNPRPGTPSAGYNQFGFYMP